MTPDAAMDELARHADPGRAQGMEAYHKVARPYLGLANPVTNEIVAGWRALLSVDERVELARALWATNVFEARLAAAKLLTQARIRPDEAAWRLIASWVPDFDSWAIADHAAMAGQRRLVAMPERLDEVEPWVTSGHMWTRRAALVFTLPWTRSNTPKPAELAQRDRILGWAAALVPDRDWFVQKAVAWWLRDLSKHDPERVRAFLDAHGAGMKAFARKEAGKYLR